LQAVSRRRRSIFDEPKLPKLAQAIGSIGSAQIAEEMLVLKKNQIFS
jgi:hypothetical protein